MLVNCDFHGDIVDESKTISKEIDDGRVIHICYDCLRTFFKTVVEKNQVKKKRFVELNLLPKDIYNKLQEYVIGQDEAKKILSVASYNHYKRINSHSNIEIEKSNILMLGPTGVGKTFLLKTLSRILNVPFAVADATSLTQSGYVGEDVENVLKRLYTASNGDMELAEQGIVYIDEVDKIASSGPSRHFGRDPSGEGVQQALLKMLEGSIVEIPKEGVKKSYSVETMMMDTKNILFVCGGSFEGIEEIIKKRVQKNGILGFTSEFKKELSKDDLYQKVSYEDFKEFGMIPEFLGRLPITLSLHSLSREDLVKILTEPKNSLVSQYIEIFKMAGIVLTFEKDSIDAIATEAIKRETGARSLRSIMEKILLAPMFDIGNKQSSIKITKDMVIEACNPIIIIEKTA